MFNWGTFRRVWIEGRALEWVTPPQGLTELSQLEQKLQSPFKEKAAVQKGKVIFYFYFLKNQRYLDPRTTRGNRTLNSPRKREAVIL